METLQHEITTILGKDLGYSSIIAETFSKTAEPVKGIHFLQSFVNSYKDAYSKNFPWDNRSSIILPMLFGNSESLSHYIINHPENISDIITHSAEKPSKVLKAMEEKTGRVWDSVIKSSHTDKCSESLRIFKNNLLSILSSKYLLAELNTEEFCHYWSMVAERCCELAYQFAYHQTTKELGEPIVKDDNGSKLDFRFAVIAVGKMGAGELNLSSDIDLIFLYNTGNGYLKGNSGKSISDLASRIATRIIYLLSNVDKNGFCFRVDTDLRPEGNQGPIATTISAATSYYEYWGTELERMMLIRAHHVAGDAGLGNEFISQIEPFIYRRSWDMTSLEKIKETKNTIEQEASNSLKSGVNIKLGNGGIREVEFIVQSIQLLHGGKDERLITRNTFRAIDAIGEGNYLPSKQCAQLRNAYVFLRHLENMLQLPEEKQTHLLPTTPDQWEGLACRMNYHDTSRKDAVHKLMSDLAENIEVIKHHFQYIFQTDFERQQMEEIIFTNIATCESEEEEIDSLPWFRKEETKKIQYLDLEKNLPIEKVSEQLSLVAEVVLAEAYKIASHSLRELYGPPTTESKNEPVAGLAIVGMGKLGGREIDYASDLDLMFIFSTNGMTSGPKILSNQEYFTKLSQRVISLISLPTRYGRAYQIDTDLRPSGRAGILVTSLNAFRNYHLTNAHIWERQALIKARPVAGDPKFCESTNKVLTELCYHIPLQEGLREKIHALRRRMEKEKALETANRYNIKLGPGGLMDIETVVQYLQLKHGVTNENFHQYNTLKCIKSLANYRIINEIEASCLLEGYRFLKGLLSRIRLFSAHASDHLTINSYQLPQIAESLGFHSKDDLTHKFLAQRKEIRNIYNSYFEDSLHSA